LIPEPHVEALKVLRRAAPSFCCDGVQGISVQTGGLPVIQKPNLVLSEELNGGPIPVKNIQHNPETVLGLCNGRDACKQGFANPFSPKLRTNEDVFEEKPAAPKRADQPG
jgi:hypothetical protein